MTARQTTFAIPSHSATAGDLSDRLGVSHPEYCQHIAFDGGDCVVMAPEDYTRLYEYADSLEQSLMQLEEVVTHASRFRDKGAVVEALQNARQLLVDNRAI